MREVPIGIQDFKKIRDSDGYFVDKSPIIDYILRKLKDVYLFTRPRRFGKSVNLSMIDAYLNIEYAGNKWFDGLEISRIRPDDPLKNSFPVIYLDMRGLGDGGYDEFVELFSFRMSDLCKRYRYLLDSDRVDDQTKADIDDICKRACSPIGLTQSLYILTGAMRQHHGKEVVVLIDEYDNAVNRSYGEDDQRRILNFMGNMMEVALKGNENLRLAVITGIMQIAKESIFSGVNNLAVNNIMSTDMDEMFGFTPEEVREICGHFGHPEKFPEAQEWYDGYHFGNTDIYNPWSVLNYISEGFKADSYWAYTSANSIIDNLLSTPDDSKYQTLMALGSDGLIDTGFDLRVTFGDLRSKGKGLLSIMALTGYLTAESTEQGVRLSIPNKEMYMVFSKTILERNATLDMEKPMRTLSEALLSGDSEKMGESLDDLFKTAISGRVLDNEHSYQAFIAGLLMTLSGNYRITADFESGDGYHDIRMERLRGNGPNVVIEIKRSAKDDPTADEMLSLAEEALEQITKRDYTHGLRGRTLLYGIAFDRKSPTVTSRELDL